MSLTFLGILVPCLCGQAPVSGSYLCQPAYARDWELRGPVEPYVPQAGDIFLATDQRLWFRWGHLIAGANGVHHSGIVLAQPDGELQLMEAGPFDKVQVEMMDPYEHMSQHAAAGDRVWVRRRKVPLSPEESARLTAFACAQNGKPFAPGAVVRPVDAAACPRSNKDLVRRRARGDRPRWFCSELVTECCVAAGIMNRATARPTATYPSDLFWGHSYNLYLNSHLDDLERGWNPPARWLPAPPQQITSVSTPMP